MDLLLCASESPTEGDNATTALANALQSGQLDSAAFNAAVQRIRTLRTTLH
jgi:beta-N-acetylhexosaminidase